MSSPSTTGPVTSTTTSPITGTIRPPRPEEERRHMSTEAEGKVGIGQRLLDWVEDVGNKLPEPFTLFLGLFLITGLDSTAMAMGGVSVTIVGDDEIIAVKRLLTELGLLCITTNLGENNNG